MNPNTAVQPADGDNERGLGKALAIGAGAAIAAVSAYAAYSRVQKKRKKKAVKTSHGKTREVECEVLTDDKGNELDGQEFDESGRCVNEGDVLSRAAAAGQIDKKGGDVPAYGSEAPAASRPAAAPQASTDTPAYGQQTSTAASTAAEQAGASGSGPAYMQGL